MFLYNLKVAFRNLLRQKGISLINIVGLSIGISCTIILFLMVHFTYNTDRFHANYDNLFLIQQKIKLSSGDYTSDRVGGAIGPALAETYPQIQSFARLGKLGEMLLAYYPEEKESLMLPISFVEKVGAAVDSTFFDVFSFEFLSGGPPKGINQNNFIYLTETLANNFFVDVDPIGKTIYFQEGLELIVTGILKDPPNSSTIKFSYLVPFHIQEMIGMPINDFGGTIYFTYFVLNNPESAEIINADINAFLDSKSDDKILEVDRFLSHIRQSFLYGETKAAWGLIIFGVIGMSILLVAGINYVNLSTAKSIDRAREVGIRKTGGASRWQLIRQFLAESILTAVVAMNLAILMVELVLPYFNNTFEAQLYIPYHTQSFWFFIVVLVLMIGTLAGFYPAFMLSSFKPSLILKNFQGGKSSGATLRKILVVSQFSITLFFIVCTIFLFKQISYIDTADLGIDKENVIFLPTRGKLWHKFDEIKSEIQIESSVKYVTTTSELPNNVNRGEIDWGKEKGKQNTIARIMWCGEDAIETFGLELLHGRFYNKNTQSDLEDGIIVNEEIIKIMNYQGDPIGQRFYLWENEKKIIGVVKDFTFFPLDIGGKALVMPYSNVNQYIFIKTNDGFNAASLGRLEKIIKKYNPDYPFEYYTFSDFKNPNFESSEHLIPILFYFSLLGIFISCLGMFGLALFTVEKRTKEIGIRKVFGASIAGITLLFSQGFVKLVLIANFIALPLAYLALRGLLGFFVVKVNLSPIIFLGTGLLIMLIALLTVLWQSISVARKNPVNSLRYE